MTTLGTVLAASEVLQPGQRTLRELADEVNREHGLVLEAGVSMVDHAIRAGDALLAAQAQIPRGSWMQWLRSDDMAFSTTTAAVYMRIARYKEVVAQGGATTIQEANALLLRAGAPHHHKGGLHKLPSWYRDEAQRLRDQGYSAYACGRELGVSPNTVQRWTEPGFAERDNEANKRRSKEKLRLRRLAKERQREQALKRAVRKEGGALAEAYALVSKLDQVLGQARQEAETKDRRAGINEMHALRDKMMDVCIRTLGVS